MRGATQLFKGAHRAADRETGSTELRDVVGYEGLYKVNDRAEVFRVCTYGGAPCFRRLAVTGKRYPRVHLSRDGVAVKESLHVVVAEAFLGPRPKGKECAHLDGNKQNCLPENLAWKTHRENEADKERHGTRKRALTREQIIKVRAEYRWFKNTGAMLAAQYGVSASVIYNAIRSAQ